MTGGGILIAGGIMHNLCNLEGADRGERQRMIPRWEAADRSGHIRSDARMPAAIHLCCAALSLVPVSTT